MNSIRRIAFVLFFLTALIGNVANRQDAEFYFGWFMAFGVIYFSAALWMRLLVLETESDVRAHRIGLTVTAAVFPILLLLVDRVWNSDFALFQMVAFTITAIAFRQIEAAMDRKVQREAAVT